jgi:hypothetical protein
VLASCETEEEVLLARSRGYATAMVVEEHAGDRRHRRGRLNLLPCPSQTRGVTCADCGLCMDDGFLRNRNLTITFAVHGSRPSRNKALRSLRASASRRRGRLA